MATEPPRTEPLTQDEIWEIACGYSEAIDDGLSAFAGRNPEIV